MIITPRTMKRIDRIRVKGRRVFEPMANATKMMTPLMESMDSPRPASDEFVRRIRLVEFRFTCKLSHEFFYIDNKPFLLDIFSITFCHLIFILNYMRYVRIIIIIIMIFYNML